MKYHGKASEVGLGVSAASYTITTICFAALIIFYFFIPDLKTDAIIYLLVFGVLTFASLFAPRPYKTSLPFYALLGLLLYIVYFSVVLAIVDLLNPNDGYVMIEGERKNVMKTNWIWGAFAGIILSPLTVLAYHRVNKRNIWLEAGLAGGFIIISTVFLIR